MFALPSLGQDSTQDNEAVGAQAQQESEPQQRPSKEDFDAAFWKDKDGSAGTYQAICEKPEDREYADLCQQWRTAVAAEKQAKLAVWQLIASIFGIGGLLATIIYTHKTYRLTARTTRSQLRAYLSTTPHFSGNVLQKIPPHFAVEVKNCGETPAYNVRGYLDGVMITDATMPEITDNGPVQPRGVINPAESIRLNARFENLLAEEDTPNVTHGSWKYWTWGKIIYDDAFGDEHHVTFRYSFGRPGAALGNCNIEEGNEAN